MVRARIDGCVPGVRIVGPATTMGVYTAAEEKRGRGFIVRIAVCVSIAYVLVNIGGAAIHAKNVYAEKLPIARLDVVQAQQSLSTEVCKTNPQHRSKYLDCVKASSAVLVVPVQRALEETYHHMLGHASVWRLVASLPGMEPDGALRGYSFNAFWWMVHFWAPLVTGISIVTMVLVLFGVCVPMSRYRTKCETDERGSRHESHSMEMARRKAAEVARDDVALHADETRRAFSPPARRRTVAAAGSAAATGQPPMYYDARNDERVVQIGV